MEQTKSPTWEEALDFGECTMSEVLQQPLEVSVYDKDTGKLWEIFSKTDDLLCSGQLSLARLGRCKTVRFDRASLAPQTLIPVWDQPCITLTATLSIVYVSSTGQSTYLSCLLPCARRLADCLMRHDCDSLFLGVLFWAIVTGSVLLLCNMVLPGVHNSGDLDVWYNMPTCASAAEGHTDFVFHQDSTANLPGVACPASPTRPPKMATRWACDDCMPGSDDESCNLGADCNHCSSGCTRIEAHEAMILVEASDGFFIFDGHTSSRTREPTYRPVVLVEDGISLTLTLSVYSRSWKPLMPPTTLKVGPQHIDLAAEPETFASGGTQPGRKLLKGGSTDQGRHAPIWESYRQPFLQRVSYSGHSYLVGQNVLRPSLFTTEDRQVQVVAPAQWASSTWWVPPCLTLRQRKTWWELVYPVLAGGGGLALPGSRIDRGLTSLYRGNTSAPVDRYERVMPGGGFKVPNSCDDWPLRVVLHEVKVSSFAERPSSAPPTVLLSLYGEDPGEKFQRFSLSLSAALLGLPILVACWMRLRQFVLDRCILQALQRGGAKCAKDAEKSWYPEKATKDLKQHTRSAMSGMSHEEMNALKSLKQGHTPHATTTDLV